MVKLWQKIHGRWHSLFGKNLKPDLLCSCSVNGREPEINERMTHLKSGYITVDPDGDLYCWQNGGGTALVGYNPCLDWNKIRDTWFGLFLSLMLIPTLIRQDCLFPFWTKWRLGGDYCSFYDDFTLIYKNFTQFKY